MSLNLQKLSPQLYLMFDHYRECVAVRRDCILSRLFTTLKLGGLTQSH